ncbi:MAG: AMP-binding protein [Deltaproteobacteria bacterium]|nr:AMP-binding protein [Deltaproteobacteria bacterium]
MTNFFWLIISYILRAVLSLRYRIQVRGLEKLTPERLNRKQGILCMPNHTAHMDPLILFLLLWSNYRMRPLVIEYIFNLPLLHPIHRLIRAIPIPNFESAVNEYKVKQAEKSMQEIAAGLKNGDNFIVYPTGRLKSTAKELLGGASGAHELLKECPEANVVLIRTTGLWGSSFSRALIGKSPKLGATMLHGIGAVIKNLIFFTPRRKVLIEIEPNPEGMPRENMTRVALNRYLENWYNRYPDEQGNIHESEPLKLVSYSRWSNAVPEIFKAAKKETTHTSGIHVSDETRSKVYGEIRRILDNPELNITPEMSLAFDLGMDSLNIAETIAFLIKNFSATGIHPEDLETVGTILAIAQGGKETRTAKAPASTYTWPAEQQRPAPALPEGRIIPEAFLNACERMAGMTACGDDAIGIMGYKRLKKAVLVLAQHFLTWEEERVAVMLPASAGAYIVILALQMAGKTPVMLNWTLGSRYLEEMMKISGAERIVTSGKFLDRLANVQFGACLDKLITLEDIRKSLTLACKLRGVYLTNCSVKQVIKAMNLDHMDENTPCVILFTSGTEAAPKGVPLSHRNIIANQRSAMQCIELNATDVMYGILPPFHSFGFSVAGLFPILGGIKAAFYPDPTDSFALAEGAHRWKITLFCSAPGFLRGLFNAAKPAQLQSIRLFVSGAEKAPPELFERVRKLNTHAQLIEGYGITECSPILTLNRPDRPPKGVGRLIPDIDLITIHPEKLERLPLGSDGEICVRGPNVFPGYLGNPRSPFIEIDGEKWYRTGDLGHLDTDGCLILSGRLKRFTKIGGEMISLGAIEEILAEHLINAGRMSPDLPSLAVCADERDPERTRLILFTTISLDREEATMILQQAGLSNLVKISSVKRIADIPIMGAGKTDYRTLQALC